MNNGSRLLGQIVPFKSYFFYKLRHQKKDWKHNTYNDFPPSLYSGKDPVLANLRISDVRRSISVLDPESQPGSGKIRSGPGSRADIKSI